MKEVCHGQDGCTKTLQKRNNTLFGGFCASYSCGSCRRLLYEMEDEPWRDYYYRAAAETGAMKYSDEVKAASEKYGVDEALIYAVIKTESNFNPDATSSAGAVGLMQLMPDTFTWMQTMYKDENDYTFEDLYDPALNIDYGTETLSVLLDMYEDEETAICAYNGGLGNVNSWLEDENYSVDGKTLKKVPFAETDNYRRTVERNKSIYNYLYFGGEKPSGVE